jgi:hypothetical protein
MEFSIVELIQSLGFPIATSVALGWYVYKTNKDSREDFLSREGKLLEANERFAIALDKAADAITEASKQHDTIGSKISCVEVKVDDLNKKVDTLLPH